ncbi:MAG TPA: diguanylate cyclase [Xanthobacteraceae bacterium]|nr:diguanylate cyclase [Xanthobacteraceae bacterium]
MRIVLVDPSRTVHRIVTRLVEPDHHDVKPFTDARAALEYIKKDPEVRALITSSEPGSMTGVELCAAARALANDDRPLYILLMSSLDERMILVKALDSGADDFIHKPPVAEELRARLRAADRVTLMQRELIKHATTDYLTGTLNRRAFFERAQKMCIQAAVGNPLTAIMIDIDHFKEVNDAYGHQIGDMVIRGCAKELLSSDHMVGRLGGEEFCVLAAKPLLDAIETAEELRAAISRLSFDGGSGAFGVTCSCGVAEWEVGDTIDRLLRRADMALYQAKLTGRNQVVPSDSYSISREHHTWRGVARSGRPRAD